MPLTYINLPGINGSDENHWHSLWEKNNSKMQRFRPNSWNEPDLDNWLDALNSAIAKADDKVVLVAHSLACLLVAHWSARSELTIAGAMLVSIPDPLGLQFPPLAKTFSDVPATSLRFPGCIVASRNDPYGSFEYMRIRANEWECGFVDAGENGHIGSEVSQDGWLFGQNILTAFTSGLG